VDYLGRVADSDPALHVVLVDDHHFFREGLRGMLEADGMVVAGEAADGVEAVSLVRELRPDVVVIDLNMPDCSGLEAIPRITAADADVQIVVLTVSADGDDVLDALAAGACSYILKDTRTDAIVSAVRQGAGGQAVLSREIARGLIAHVRASADAAREADARRPAFTAREVEVLKLIADGADNATIGRQLSISPHTVKQYVTNIFEKLGVHSRVQAAVYAVRAGLV